MVQRAAVLLLALASGSAYVSVAGATAGRAALPSLRAAPGSPNLTPTPNTSPTPSVPVVPNMPPAPNVPPAPELPLAGSAVVPPRRPPRPAWGEATIVLRLLRLEPAARSTVARKRPEVSATFSEDIDTRGARVWLDGRDVTAETFINGRGVAYEPTSDLMPGEHDVVIDGRTPAHEIFREGWSFSTTSVATSNYVSGLEPSNGTLLAGNVVEVSGFTRPRSRIRILATTSETVPTFGGVTPGSSTTDAVASRTGFFSAAVQIVERGSRLLDMRVASTAPDGMLAVRTLRLRR